MTAAEAPRRLRILVADDEESIRFVLREALEGEGHAVEEARDGQAADQALSAGDFDLAFLDIRMPGLTGLEVLDLRPLVLLRLKVTLELQVPLVSLASSSLL